MVNDLSERHWQVERGGQWSKGKSFDTFTPLGPWLVSASELREPGALELKLDVNGAMRQRGNTADLIFDVDTIVSYCSQFMTLRPGHLIITGTPAGVGFGMAFFQMAIDKLTLALYLMPRCQGHQPTFRLLREEEEDAEQLLLLEHE